MMRDMCRLLCGLLLVTVAWAGGAYARWEGATDNKSDATLGSMELKALFEEGFDVCVRRAILSSGAKPGQEPDEAVAAANDYLSVIEGHVRDKSGGRLPDWMRALSFARTTKECQAVFRGFVGGEMAPETKPAQARPSAAPTVARPTAVPTRPRPTPVPTRTRAAAAPTRTRAIPTPTEPEPEPTATRIVAKPTPAAPTHMPTATRVPTLAPRPTRPLPTAKMAYYPPTPVMSPVTRKRPAPTPANDLTDELPPWFRPRER